MAYERVQKSSSWNTQPQAKPSYFVPPLTNDQLLPHSQVSLTQQEIENQAFQQHKHEATRLELQAKSGTLDSTGHEHLTVLQAKMDAFWQRRMEHSSRFGHRLENISFAPRKTLALQPIQTKLMIGEPGDKYEQEADQVAAHVVSQINAPLPQQSSQSKTIQREEMLDDEPVMMKPIADLIQREEIPDDEQVMMRPMVQYLSKAGGMTSPPELEASIQQARSSGQPLANNIRTPMEQAFGADFSGVRVHTDAQSNQLNQSIQAKAFTTGQDIFFRQGTYDPSSQGGQELIAHELTHVVQQNGATLQRPSESNRKKHPAETKGVMAKEAPDKKNGEVIEQPKLQGKDPGLIQRATVVVHTTGDSDESYNEVLEDATTFHNIYGTGVLYDTKHEKITGAGADEAHIDVFGHGNPASVGDFTPETFAKFVKENLEKLQLDKVETVTLHSCESGKKLTFTEDDDQNIREKYKSIEGTTFVERLHMEFFNAYKSYIEVTGQQGESFTDSAGRTRVLKAGKTQDEYKRALKQAKQGDREDEPDLEPSQRKRTREKAVEDEYLLPPEEGQVVAGPSQLLDYGINEQFREYYSDEQQPLANPGERKRMNDILEDRWQEEAELGQEETLLSGQKVELKDYRSDLDESKRF